MLRNSIWHNALALASFYLATLLFCVLDVSPARGQTFDVIHRFIDQSEGCDPQLPDLLAQGRDGNLYGTVPFCGASFDGTIFRITPGGTFRILYQFDSTHGAFPYGGLTLGSDGNFYGTTSEGGSSGYGTIFRITPGGLLTTLYNFTLGSDGGNPHASPVEGVDANFYGTTVAGTAYKITRSGFFTSLASLPGASYAPLTQSLDGNFYGTTIDGGTFGKGTVFKISRAGVLAVLYNFNGNDGSCPLAPVTLGNDGNLYGTTFLGGPLSGGEVFRLAPGAQLTVLQAYDLNQTDNGTLPSAGLILATDGTFYGAAAGGGTFGDGVLFSIDSYPTYSVLYTFDGTTGSSPSATPVQHTSGIIYGLTNTGGGQGSAGVLYSLNVGLTPFVKLVTTSGRVGSRIGILGGGFTGTSSVKFNGTPATFTVVSNTFLTTTVPAGATSGFVTVTTPTGIVTSNVKFQVRP